MGPSASVCLSVQLPKSSSRADKQYAHCKVLTGIGPRPLGAAFEGEIYPPGAIIPAEALGRGVALECVGSIGNSRGHNRAPLLWILWQYDFPRGEWTELGRAASVDAGWSAALSGPAMAALSSSRDPLEAVRTGRDLAEEIMAWIDARVAAEARALRLRALACVYDQVGGRMAAAEYPYL